jgi:hypothetical protein
MHVPKVFTLCEKTRNFFVTYILLFLQDFSIKSFNTKSNILEHGLGFQNIWRICIFFCFWLSVKKMLPSFHISPSYFRSLSFIGKHFSPSVNVTNILRRAFFVQKFHAKLFCTNILSLNSFWHKNIGANASIESWWNWPRVSRSRKL